MTEYSRSFIIFSKNRMATQGDLIKAWVNDSDPLLRECCKKIIEAAQ